MAEPVLKKKNSDFHAPQYQADATLRNRALDLSKLFIAKDRNHDGRVDFNEFVMGEKITSTNTLDSQKKLFRLFDTDGDGALTSRDDLDGDARISLTDRKLLKSPSVNSQPYGDLTPENSVTLNRAVDREQFNMRDKLSKVPAEKSIGDWVFSKTPLLYLHTIPVTNLSPKLDGISILHLSDLHFKNSNNASILAELGALISQLPNKPDLVVATGDFISAQGDDLSPAVRKFLANLYPDLPKIAVLGNHDYLTPRGHIEKIVPAAKRKFVSGSYIAKQLEESGFIVLRNESVRLLVREAPINITGTEDQSKGIPQLPEPGVSSPEELAILLVHNLDVVTKASPKNYDLILSGHTHSGELQVPSSTLDGTLRLKLNGDFIDRNNQIRGFKALSWRTLSYVSPGFERRLDYRSGSEVKPSGISLLTLKNFIQ